MADLETMAAPSAAASGSAQIMSIRAAQDLERSQAHACDYYAVFLKSDATDEIVRVRTPVWQLDADRCKVIVDDKPRLRNPHDVALDVWAAYGAEEYTLQMVMRGGFVVATPASIANELSMKRIAASGE